MKEWLLKRKGRILVALLIVAVLTTAFYYGGNAPGLQGWSIKPQEAGQAQGDIPAEGEAQGETEDPLSETVETPQPESIEAETAPVGTDSTPTTEPTTREETVGSAVEERPGGQIGRASGRERG